jgi:hypothetical protein
MPTRKPNLRRVAPDEIANPICRRFRQQYRHIHHSFSYT